MSVVPVIKCFRLTIAMLVVLGNKNSETKISMFWKKQRLDHDVQKY